jgi:hypothetical protein
MSKRKRASLGKTTPGSEQNPAAEETSDEAKADMVHVTPDLLSGSPDIFSSRGKEGAAPIEPEAAEPPATVSEPTEPEAPINGTAAPEEHEESEVAAAATPEAIPAPVHEPAAITPEPARVSAPSRAAQFMRRTPRGAGTSAALGIVLVVLGLFALLVAVSGVDLTQYGWPLFVIVPGLTLLVVGFVGVGPGASIPGGIVTTLGLLLAYQNATGDWASWAYAWALVAPGGIGLGMYLQALRDRDRANLKTGRSLMFIGLLIFMIGFVFFESIMGISGRDYGMFGKAALPVLLIVIGIILVLRSIQRSRRG